MKVTQVLLIEGSVNLLVTLAKVVVGGQTGSSAILADAFHSAMDMSNNLLAWLAQRIANKPADPSHPYGHKKFEYLAVFLLAVLLCVLAIELVSHALTRLSHTPEQSLIGLGLLMIAVIASLLMSLFEGYWAKRLSSRLLDADAKHSLADMGTSLAAILGWQLSMYGFPWLDALMSVIIALIVLFLAYGLFKQVIPVLVDQAVVDEKQLIRAARQVPGVLAIKQVRSRSTGEGKIVEIKAAVGAHLTTQASHHIADQLEADLARRFDLLDVIVHIEPD